MLGDPAVLDARWPRGPHRPHDAFRAGLLGQKLLQLLAPGVPDVYQGTELVDLSLVDPDNRRPVDYAAAGRRLPGLDGGAGAGGRTWTTRSCW